MKKAIHFISFLLLLFISLSVTSCYPPSNQNSYNRKVYREDPRVQWRNLYGSTLEEAANQMTSGIIEMISPISGKGGQYTVYYENIYYNKYTNSVSADVLLRWQARDVLSGVGYGECQLLGNLQVFLPLHAKHNTTAEFKVKQWNEHLIQVSSKRKLNQLKKGVEITLQ